MSMFHKNKDAIIQAVKERFPLYWKDADVTMYEDYYIDKSFEKGEVSISLLINEKKLAYVECRVFFKNNQFACDFLYGDNRNTSEGIYNDLFGDCFGKDFDTIEEVMDEFQSIIDRQTSLYAPAEKYLSHDKRIYRVRNLTRALSPEKEVFPE